MYDCCHDMTQKPMSFDNVAIVTVKGNDYGINFLYITVRLRIE